MKKLVSFFEGKAIGKVLDVGTGSGNFIGILNTIFDVDTEFIGIDPSKEAIDEAQKKNYRHKTVFEQMEGEHMNFADKSFDVVSMSNALHHLASHKQTLAEMKRVVSDKGWIVIAELVSDGLSEAEENQKISHHFKGFIDRKMGLSHRETYTRAEIIEIISSAGIVPVLTFEYERMPTPITEPEELAQRADEFAKNLRKLEGTSEYAEKAALFDTFKKRLAIYGFQQACQIVVVGQKN